MYTNIENEIVITSRIRLARNLKNYKFPTKMSQEDAINVIKDIQKSAENCECHVLGKSKN